MYELRRAVLWIAGELEELREDYERDSASLRPYVTELRTLALLVRAFLRGDNPKVLARAAPDATTRGLLKYLRRDHLGLLQAIGATSERVVRDAEMRMLEEMIEEAKRVDAEMAEDAAGVEDGPLYLWDGVDWREVDEEEAEYLEAYWDEFGDEAEQDEQDEGDESKGDDCDDNLVGEDEE
jgi:hypothetical protein